MSKAASSTSSSRRRLLRVGATGSSLVALGACGFQPLYGPAPAVSGGADMRRELAAVKTDYVGERVGVLLRRALDRRFESAAAGMPVPPRYTLQLDVGYGAEILGYRADGGISRIRYTATSNWVLLTRSSPPDEIGRGLVRTFDAFNLPDYQFFSAEVSRDAMEQRLVNEIVEQVFLAVATKLRERLRTAQG